MQPLASDARRRAPRDPRRADRHRRHAVDARPSHRAKPTPRWSGCAPPASSSSRSPAGPPDGAITSRGCGRSTRSSARTARSTCATTPRRASSSGASSTTSRRDARHRDAARGASPRRSSRRSPAARSRPISAIARPTSRSISARTCLRCRARRSIASSRMMQAEGMTAKVSSIHVNGWFGTYDKLTMTRTLLAEVFGIDLDAEREQFVFAGDSPNDAPMFAFFPNAVGVANVRAFADRIATLPAYVTQRRVGRRIRGAREFPAGVSARQLAHARARTARSAGASGEARATRARALPRSAAPRSISPSARSARTSRP